VPFPPRVPRRRPPSLATARPRFHHNEVRTGALTLYGPQADAGDPVSGLPPSFLSGRPTPPWTAPPVSSQPSPNWFTKSSWSSSHHSPKGLVAAEPESAGRRHPPSSARLLWSGWASCQNGRPTRWARPSHQQKQPKCTVHFYFFSIHLFESNSNSSNLLKFVVIQINSIKI
jgi:hypothetical protein